jgi:hypothetical protein
MPGRLPTFRASPCGAATLLSPSTAANGREPAGVAAFSFKAAGCAAEAGDVAGWKGAAPIIAVNGPESLVVQTN